MSELIKDRVLKNNDWVTSVEFTLDHPINTLIKNGGKISQGPSYKGTESKPTEEEIIADAFKIFIEAGGNMEDIKVQNVFIYRKEIKCTHSGTAQP